MKGIQKIDDSAMAISRRKMGRGYAYYNENNIKITDKKVLRRLRKLVIPPMWSDVFICRFDDGHIQAIGRDLKGRKQYIYHSVYEKLKQEEKFKKMLDFANRLPEVRKQVLKDIKKKNWRRNKVLALIVLILDEYGVRIGNKQYRNRNDTYGLTTLRRKHLNIEDDELIFSFNGKSKKQREVHIDDEELIAFIKEAANLPGYEIFRYRDDSGNFHDVDSEEVNDYISKFMGEDFSSKDFRTWTANRLAMDLYPEAIHQQKEGQRKKFSNILIKMVAGELGNTPNVCRDYYVHPAIFNKVDKKEVPYPNPFKDSKTNHGLTASEKLARKIIQESY